MEKNKQQETARLDKTKIIREKAEEPQLLHDVITLIREWE